MIPDCDYCGKPSFPYTMFLRWNYGRRYHGGDPTVVRLCDCCKAKHADPEPEAFTRIQYV